MPTRRRRKILVAAGASMGTLLGDIERERKVREQEEARAKSEAKENAGERSRRYANIVSNYVKDQSITFEEADKLLRDAQAEETDPELREFLKDYLKDLKITKQAREVNNLVDDYTYGRRSYESFKSAMGRVGPENGIIADAVAKHLAAARKTENNRLVSKWSADYQSGELQYDSFIKNLNDLRSQPDQKDPNDLAAISQHIEAAQQNEQSLQDNKTFIQWQSTGDSSSALQYFNSRLAKARNVKDANSVEAYIKTIQAEDKKRGQAGAEASQKALNALMEAATKSYEEKNLKTELAAAKNNPFAIMAAYGRYASFLSDKVLSVGGSDAPKYRILVESLPELAAAAASDAVFNEAMEDIKKWNDLANDKGADPATQMKALKKVAEVAATTETSQWLIAGHDDMRRERDMAATRLSDMARKLQAEKEAVRSEANVRLGALYDNAMDAVQPDDKGKLIGPGKSLKSAMDSGIKFDGTAADKNAFVEWVMQDPEERAGLISKAAGADVSLSLSKDALGQTKTTTTIKDPSVEEQTKSTLSLLELFKLNQSLTEQTENAFIAATDAFAPGASRGRFNIQAPDVFEEMTAMREGQAENRVQARKLTPAQDRLLQVNVESAPDQPGDDRAAAGLGQGGLAGPTQKDRTFFDVAGDPFAIFGPLSNMLRAKSGAEQAAMRGESPDLGAKYSGLSDVSSYLLSKFTSGPEMSAMRDAHDVRMPAPDYGSPGSAGMLSLPIPRFVPTPIATPDGNMLDPGAPVTDPTASADTGAPEKTTRGPF